MPVTKTIACLLITIDPHNIPACCSKPLNEHEFNFPQNDGKDLIDFASKKNERQYKKNLGNMNRTDEDTSRSISIHLKE
ncbi:hypothetical protein JTB14_006470 [Gonioctena quinquepunctata]|nr:hypothetical protein JTB14_006470 [Gonioctena quinquepunctata]